MQALEIGKRIVRCFTHQDIDRNMIKDIFNHQQTHKPIHRVERVLDFQEYLKEAMEKEINNDRRRI